jgi:hypothetical protein
VTLAEVVEAIREHEKWSPTEGHDLVLAVLKDIERDPDFTLRSRLEAFIKKLEADGGWHPMYVQRLRALLGEKEEGT